MNCGDDEIDSIRAFDADSQRSIENYKSYTVFPATEFLFTEDEIEHGIEKSDMRRMNR